MGSVVVAHGLKLLRGTWDLPGPGLEPVFPALTGGFLTTGPPGKSLETFLDKCSFEYLFSVLGVCT